MTETDHEGGDPACWGHLHDTEIEAPSDTTLAELMRNLADAVIVCDADGRITFWNSAATRIFGWNEDQALGESLDIIIPERLRKRHWDGYYGTMRTGLTSYGDRLLEVPALNSKGETFSIAFTVSLLRIEGSDRLTGIAAVIRDDTARRAELKELRAAARGATQA